MHSSRIRLLAICISFTLLLLASGRSQTQTEQSPLSGLSDKDLFKKADADDKAGRLESAVKGGAAGPEVDDAVEALGDLCARARAS